MSHEFTADAMKLSARRNMRWFQNNLMDVLQSAKDKQARDVDKSLELAKQLVAKLNEKVDLPVVVPSHDVVPSEDDSLMKPVEPEVSDILLKATEKGSGARYLAQRNKKSPEDKYFFRIVSSWDYGWQQKHSRLLSRDVHRGRCAIIHHTFYRKNNLGPDPIHYGIPTGGQISICSEYSCNPN